MLPDPDMCGASQTYSMIRPKVGPIGEFAKSNAASIDKFELDKPPARDSKGYRPMSVLLRGTLAILSPKADRRIAPIAKSCCQNATDVSQVAGSPAENWSKLCRHSLKRRRLAPCR